MTRYVATGLLLLLICSYSFSQDRSPGELFYLWKKNWTPTTQKDSAAFFSRMHRVNDTCWQMDTYNYAGPLVFAERYKDNHAGTPHGRQLYYQPSGYIDSSGNYINGVPDGDWNYCNDSGRVITRKHYDMGKLISTEIAPASDSTEKHNLKPGEVESTFPGGLPAWKKYLGRKLEYPERASKFQIEGEVWIYFEVETTGAVGEALIMKSVEYSLDELSLSIIRKSPKWSAAIQDGHPVKSFKKQPMIYRVR